MQEAETDLLTLAQDEALSPTLFLHVTHTLLDNGCKLTALATGIDMFVDRGASPDLSSMLTFLVMVAGREDKEQVRYRLLRACTRTCTA